MGEPTPKKTPVRGARRRLVGKVVSNTKKPGRAKKTVTVEVTRNFRDPVYGKYVKRTKKFHAHDETEEYRINDLVEIEACRPRSATKRWQVIRLISRPVEV